MKICLIFPNIFLGNYLKVNVPIHPPLSLAYLGAILRENGIDVSIIDAAAENLSIKKLISRVGDILPDVIGITANISSSRKAIMTSLSLKRTYPKIPIIFGGPWSTIEYRKILDKKYGDFVVLGEGEYTLLELLENLHDMSILKNIRGISYLDSNDNIIVTPPRGNIENLDDLPFPAWDLLPSSKKYNFPHRKTPYYPIMTTRGCPYDCIHCTKVVHGYKYRKRSIKNVIGELEYLKKNFGTKEIFIIDDNFNHDITRAEKICDEMIARDFNFLIKFSNGIRADRITPRLGRKLKAAGTYFAALGIESGNQEIVNRIGKRLDLKKVVQAVKILKKNKISSGGFFILGHPHDSFKTMLQTLNFAKSLDLDYPHFFKSLPFPGTKMFDIIKENEIGRAHV